MTAEKTIDDFTGSYGEAWRTGVLTDHVYTAMQAGMLLMRSPKGWAHMTGPRGGASYPVLCGEIVPIATEDGVIDGRCGMPVRHGFEGGPELGCPGHHEQIIEWARQRDQEASR